MTSVVFKTVIHIVEILASVLISPVGEDLNQVSMAYLGLQELRRWIPLLLHLTAHMTAESHRILASIVGAEVFDRSLSFS